jgi:1-aminocyclopropane-1-carboxylate deaminase/D-cysteine desulfhydrase-like pyridoxal-dependent ACC family enzyme
MDRPVRHPRRSWVIVTTTAAGTLAGLVTLLTVAATVMLVTNPAVAAEVTGTGSLMPLARALALAAGRTLVAWLRYL